MWMSLPTNFLIVGVVILSQTLHGSTSGSTKAGRLTSKEGCVSLTYPAIFLFFSSVYFLLTISKDPSCNVSIFKRLLRGHLLIPGSHGEPYRHFSAIIGWKALSDSVGHFGHEHEFTKLVTDLKGKDPDDAFSSIPYEKGFNFLFHLETILGKTKFDKFIPHVCLISPSMPVTLC